MAEHGCRSFLSLGDQAQPQTEPSAAAPPSQRGGYPQNLSGQAPAGALSIGPVTADTKDVLPRFLRSFSSCCLSKVCQRITLHKHMILTGQPHSHALEEFPIRTTRVLSTVTRDAARLLEEADQPLQTGLLRTGLPLPKSLVSEHPSPGEEPQLIPPWRGKGALSMAIALVSSFCSSPPGTFPSSRFHREHRGLAPLQTLPVPRLGGTSCVRLLLTAWENSSGLRFSLGEPKSKRPQLRLPTPPFSRSFSTLLFSPQPRSPPGDSRAFPCFP